MLDGPRCIEQRFWPVRKADQLYQADPQLRNNQPTLGRREDPFLWSCMSTTLAEVLIAQRKEACTVALHNVDD